MDKSAKIYVAGHRGLVGAAIVRKLEQEGYRNLLLRTPDELDLRDQQKTDAFFKEQRPEYVFLAAAVVGGIVANSTRPAEFIGDNLKIQTNVIHSAWCHGTRKLLFLGSSCVYPKFAPQPIQEASLLTSPLEPTNDAYAIAKIAGLRMAQAYRQQYGFSSISLMPTNLFGPGDNFELTSSHVLPALIRRFHEARENGLEEVKLWGTGTPRREFLYVDDLSEAALMLMDRYDSPEIINVGTGEDITIRELAESVAAIVDYRGTVTFDPTKPDGTPRKLLDVSKLHSFGWRAKTPLEVGIRRTYRFYLELHARTANVLGA